MIKSVLIISLSLLLSFLVGSNAMARSPLPNLTTTRIISPVCVVSGIAETEVQSLQSALCETAARLLSDRGARVEVLALNDPRLSEAGRLIIGLRFHIEATGEGQTLLTVTGQVSGDGRRIPTAAHGAPFDTAHPVITPAIRESLQKVLQEHGLL